MRRIETEPQWRWVSRALVATILWVVVSIGFTVYVANFNSYPGSLGGVIILLTWLYLSAWWSCSGRDQCPIGEVDPEGI